MTTNKSLFAEPRALKLIRSSFEAAGGCSLVVGTFLLAFAFVSFEITTIRTINFVLGPGYIYFAIAIAMLGFSAAGSILSLADLKFDRASRDLLLVLICVGAAALILLAHFLTSEAKQELNAAVRAAGLKNGFVGAVSTTAAGGLVTALRTGLVLSLPYFSIGAGLSLLFATVRSRSYGLLYAADLIGAAAGCIVAILIMEVAGYAFSATLPAIAAVIAAAAFAISVNMRLVLVGLGLASSLLILPFADFYSKAIEPPADPHYLVRDYRFKQDVRELWRGWNSYTRVGAIESRDGDHTFAIMSLGNGEGMAWLMPFPPPNGEARRHMPALIARLLGTPNKVLVLMAGAGADLLSLHELGGGKTEATGIELNATLVKGARALHGFGLDRLLDHKQLDLKVSEGRVYLEQTVDYYDLILMSFSGATASYYAGMLGATTQFMYTYEGLEAILNHLRPGGHAVILQVNKLRMLGALRRYMDKHRLRNPPQAAIILFRPTDRANSWAGAWDDNPLLIKPDGWTTKEISAVTTSAAEAGWQVAYAPGMTPHPQYEVYARVLRAQDYEKALDDIGRGIGKRFDIITDDRPFFLDIFRTEKYFMPSFWRNLQSGDISYEDSFQGVRVFFVFAIISIGATLILAPLFLRSGPKCTVRNFNHLAYFLCLGAGFMLIELALIQKALLVFGNPALSIAILLFSIILFSGIGSILSVWSFRRGVRFYHVAGGVAIYSFLLGVTLDWLLPATLAWPLSGKVLGVVAIAAPGALLMGHLFPQGLALIQQDDRKLIPWAWGINGVFGTAAAGMAPLVAQALGTNALLLIGASFYAFVLLLQPYGPWSDLGRLAQWIVSHDVLKAYFRRSSRAGP
jgi:hypothetical protein